MLRGALGSCSFSSALLAESGPNSGSEARLEGFWNSGEMALPGHASIWLLVSGRPSRTPILPHATCHSRLPESTGDTRKRRPLLVSALLVFCVRNEVCVGERRLHALWFPNWGCRARTRICQMATSAVTETPALDREAARTFEYPDGSDRHVFRGYQFSITTTALKENTLVSLPTGTGKTLIGAVVAQTYLRWFPDGLVVFLAMTRPLVAQQIRACCGTVGLDPDVDAQLLTGDDPPHTRRARWTSSSARVIFCTPHALLNDLDRELLDCRRIVCCIFDEARETGGGPNHSCVTPCAAAL